MVPNALLSSSRADNIFYHITLEIILLIVLISEACNFSHKHVY